MLRLRNVSIQRKLTLIIMAAGLTGVLLVAAGFVSYELVTYRRTMTRDLATLAEIIGNESTAALSFEEKERAEEILNALRAEKHLVVAGLYKDGRLFARYVASNSAERPDSFPARPGPVGARFEKDHLVLFHDIVLKGEVIGTLYLQSDLLGMRERFERYAAIVALVTLASCVAIYFLSALLQRIISRPILHLAATARAVSADRDYSLRARTQGADEIGQLIGGFNEMLGQIQQRDAALHRANDGLERRVQERTRDLQQEILERKRAESALQDQFTRTTLVNHITQVISERQDLDSILYVVLRQLEDHLGLEMGLVCLFDSAAETLSVGALRLRNPDLAPRLDLREGMSFPLDPSGLRLCKHGERLNLSLSANPMGLLPARLAAAELHTAVAVPLLVEKNLFGILIAARPNNAGFDEGECHFLEAVSKHVALAGHQAQLHSRLEEAYNQLRQTQQAVMQQQKLKALGQMASGIAHDVNNALSPIVGFSDLLVRLEAGLTPNGKKYLQYIKTAGEDIAHIVARLREFYRRRDEAENLVRLNLNELAKQVVDMTRPRWRDIPQGRGIMVEMTTELDPRLPEVDGIESEIREAVTNLIINAVDAMPSGGTITVRTRVQSAINSATTASMPQRILLEVADSGTGMDEDTRRRCMEPFFSTKGQRGTGMGLAMVYGVMERHKGTVGIESALGQGTTLALIFPTANASAQSGATAEIEDSLPPLHILCIDDEPLVRELLKDMLEQEGHTVTVADGGQAGVDAFRDADTRDHPFDVVITDLGMPYVDGRQVAGTVKRESPATPVLLLTGWGTFMKEDGDLPAQVDAVLSKPPRSNEIREALRRALSDRTDVDVVPGPDSRCLTVAAA